MDQAKQKAETERQELISALEQAVETLHGNTERIQALEKSWHESEWYLGEARARNQKLEDELRDKDLYIRKIEHELYELRSHHEQSHQNGGAHAADRQTGH